MAPEDPNEKKLPRFGGNERFVVDAETFRVHNLPDGERGGEGEAKLSRSGNERFVGDGSGLEVTKSPPGSPADIESYEPSAQTTPVLLADWAAIMRELRVRDVIRTNNNPVGDIPRSGSRRTRQSDRPVALCRSIRHACAVPIASDTAADPAPRRALSPEAGYAVDGAS